MHNFANFILIFTIFVFSYFFRFSNIHLFLMENDTVLSANIENSVLFAKQKKTMSIARDERKTIYACIFARVFFVEKKNLFETNV